MSDARWFKLLIRAIGVLTIVLSVPRVGQAVIAVGMFMDPGWSFGSSGRGSTGGSWWTPYMFSAIVAFVAVAAELTLGIYLLCGAPRLVRYCIRHVGYRCSACDYDIRGLKGACPECGHPIAGTPTPDR